MPTRRSRPPRARSALPAAATLVAHDLVHARGGRPVLEGVSLTVGPERRIGVVGPNGAGKSTLLRLLAGVDRPDRGIVTRDPPDATVGYLAQEQERVPGETVRALLTRRTGVADAEAELLAAASGLAAGGPAAEHRYETALARCTALGAGDVDVRIDEVLADLGLGTGTTEQPTTTLSGGEEAKVALAAVELSRFDVTLLDEPTNDLDFAGLARLESWVADRRGGLVVVSHDRAFLERSVDSVLELDAHDHGAREYGGGWAGYEAERAAARHHAEEAYGVYDRERAQLQDRARRQREWAVRGTTREQRSPRDHDRAQRGYRLDRTEKQAAKARRTARALTALAPVAKPWEGWALHFSIEEAPRAGAVVARLDQAVMERGGARVGPVDLEIGWGERWVLTGANGTGKSTVLGAVLGTVPLASGERWLGPSVVPGVLGQDRRALGSHRDLVDDVCRRCRLTVSEARSLLAKFGLDAESVRRPPATLSPGERTRAELATFQALGVNFLVLDEPTNHLDLPGIEQLEAALDGFSGTLLLVTHDRRLLATLSVDHRCDLGGSAAAGGSAGP